MSVLPTTMTSQELSESMLKIAQEVRELSPIEIKAITESIAERDPKVVDRFNKLTNEIFNDRMYWEQLGVNYRTLDEADRLRVYAFVAYWLKYHPTVSLP